jgi:hypothetical protein
VIPLAYAIADPGTVMIYERIKNKKLKIAYHAPQRMHRTLSSEKTEVVW